MSVVRTGLAVCVLCNSLTRGKLPRVPPEPSSVQVSGLGKNTRTTTRSQGSRMTIVAAEEEVKRETSPWALGISDLDRELVEEASKNYISFDEYWLACLAQLEGEGELTSTHELVAEYRGWAAQLTRMRRTTESRSAEKRGRLNTTGDNTEIWQKVEAAQVPAEKPEDNFGFANNQAWKDAQAAAAGAQPAAACKILQDAAAAAKEPPETAATAMDCTTSEAAPTAAAPTYAASSSQEPQLGHQQARSTTHPRAQQPVGGATVVGGDGKPGGGVRRSTAAVDIAQRMREAAAVAEKERKEAQEAAEAQRASMPARSTAHPRAYQPVGGATAVGGEGRTGGGQKKPEICTEQETMEQIRMSVANIEAMRGEVEQKGLRMEDEKLVAVAASLAHQLNRNIVRASRTDNECGEVKVQAGRSAQALTKVIEISARNEAYQTIVSVIKKKGMTTEDFKRYAWPCAERRARQKDISDLIASAKAIGGAGKIFIRHESDAKKVSNLIFAALKEEAFEGIASVFVGKGETKRAIEEQQGFVYQAVVDRLGLSDPEQRKATALKTQWPSERNDHRFCYFLVDKNGAPKEVLAAGHIRMQQMVVDVAIWDEEILENFYAQIQKAGGATRLLFDTNDLANELKDKDDLLRMAPTPEELKEIAAKGKGKKGGGKSSEEQQKGDKGGGKGKKHKDGNGGGKIPAWNPGKGAGGAGGGSKGSSEQW